MWQGYGQNLRVSMIKGWDQFQKDGKEFANQEMLSTHPIVISEFTSVFNTNNNNDCSSYLVCLY